MGPAISAGDGAPRSAVPFPRRSQLRGRCRSAARHPRAGVSLRRRVGAERAPTSPCAVERRRTRSQENDKAFRPRWDESIVREHFDLLERTHSLRGASRSGAPTSWRFRHSRLHQPAVCAFDQRAPSAASANGSRMPPPSSSRATRPASPARLKKSVACSSRAGSIRRTRKSPATCIFQIQTTNRGSIFSPRIRRCRKEFPRLIRRSTEIFPG